MKRLVQKLFLKKAFSRKYVLRAGFAIGGAALVVILLILFTALSTKVNPIPEKLARQELETKQNIVNDVTELNPVQTQGVVLVHTDDEIVSAVRSHDRVSIGGGRNSMGGQTASERAVQIDMREYNKILNFSTSSKEITVQAGIRWRDIQDYIDPYDLSVKIMQTYSNFTVGGSLSVNVHGRYIGLGPIILSVKQFHIVLADGSLALASPSENADIFYSAIGGMGGMGVITDVTLFLADNVNVERVQETMTTGEYWDYFKKNVRTNSDVIFHNGDMYPPSFAHISGVSWVKTNKAVNTKERLIPRSTDYWKERIAWVVMSEWPFGRAIREYMIDPILYLGDAPVHSRNYEASYDVAELEPKDRDGSTYVLQEYFVPVENFDAWVPKMKKVFNDYDVNVINVSIRHALPDPGAKLAWARSESFAFVVYYKQGTSEKEKAEVGTWTRAMIEQVLTVDGGYYLPYQLLATDQELHRAYPNAVDYFNLKKQYDPTDKFTNKLWDKYYSEEKLQYYTKKREERIVASTSKEYYRPYDNAYLSLPEWYIVYSADEYSAALRDGLPSQFPYSQANQEYWRQYQRVVSMTAASPHDNSDYLTVLSIIGWSYSAENGVKCVYENSIGRVSEWIAGGTQVPEDHYAATVAKAYADFIYDYPWYDFPYFTYLKGVWALDNQEDYSWSQDIRRLERKIFLTLEYGIKSVYSSVIAYATHTKFGVQDDIISAIITHDDGKTYEIISAPHYQPFTRKLIEEMKSASSSSVVRIVDIAGNNEITLAYLDNVGASIIGGREIMRDEQIVGKESGLTVSRDRITIEVDVADIITVYRALKEKGITIDHFYDY